MVNSCLRSQVRWFKEVFSVFGLLFVALIGVVGSAILNNHIELVYKDLYGLTQWPWKWMMKMGSGTFCRQSQGMHASVIILYFLH